MNYPITRTKVILPGRQSDLLSRHRLLDLLDDALDYRLTLITAPAGYGKTSLLVDHASRVDYPVGWLALDPLDQDFTRFLHYFTAAVRQVFPEFGNATRSLIGELEESELGGEQVLRTIVNDLYDHVQEHFMLVLDDFHLVQDNDQVPRFINDFSQAVDENCHLVIASRSLINLPDLPLMIGRSQVKGLSFEELAFLPEEIQGLYQVKYDTSLSRGEAEEMAAGSEGWITGLLLSAEVQRQGTSEQARAIRTAGVDLYDYLAQQVLEQQTPELQDFLLRTSLLEEFNADLCSQALGEPPDGGTWENLIDQLRSGNLFIQPVENGGTWLRYHHLFRDFLQHHFQELDPEGARALQARLVEVYRINGWLERGYAACQQLNDPENMAGFISSVGPVLLHSGQLSMLKTWIDELPRILLEQDPRLFAYRAVVEVMTGDPTSGLRMINWILDRSEYLDDQALLAQLLIRRATCQRLLGSYHEGLKDGRTALHVTDGQEDMQALAAEAEREIGLNQMRMGSNQAAEDHLSISLRMYEQLDDRKNAAYVQMDLGLMEMRGGNYPTSMSLYQHAFQLWKGLNNFSQLVYLCNNLGVLNHLSGNYQDAYGWFKESLKYAGKTNNKRGTAYTLASLADLALDLGALLPAESYIYESETLADQISDPYLIIYLGLARAGLARAREQYEKAALILEEVSRQIDPHSTGMEKGNFHLERGQLYLEQEQIEQAIQELEEAREVFSATDQPVETGLAVLLLAGLDCHAGNRSSAVQRMAAYRDIIRQLSTLQPFIPTLVRQEGMLECLLGVLPDEELLQELSREKGNFQDRLPEILEHLAADRLPLQPSREPLLEIQGLGRIQLKQRGELLTAQEWTKQRTVRELLYYLLSCPEGASREEICLEFWPESEPDKLTRQFKNALYRLRRAIGKESVVYDTVSKLYSFNRQVDYRYDVEEFEKALQAADGLKTPAQRMDSLKVAAGLYQHPFAPSLEGVWSEAVRYQLYLDYERAALELGDLQLAAGQPEDCLDTARDLLEITPVQEEAWRLVLQAYGELGDRSGIERAYQRCLQSFAEELDAEPSPETQALYQELMH